MFLFKKTFRPRRLTERSALSLTDHMRIQKAALPDRPWRPLEKRSYGSRTRRNR